jgi:channel protein (hemolysin III family)
MSPNEASALPFCYEPVSSFSHLLGAILFSALAVVLLRRGRGDWGRIISLSVLAGSTILLLILSGLYHLVPPGASREFLVRADVSAVFLLIAGSLTPVQAILFRGPTRWVSLVLTWVTAILGATLRMAFFETLSGEAGIAIFLALGWVGALCQLIVCDKYGWTFIRLGVWSGLTYTVGALVLVMHRPVVITGLIGPHEVWHSAVLIALGLHWAFVFQFATGQIPLERRARNCRPALEMCDSVTN